MVLPGHPIRRGCLPVHPVLAGEHVVKRAEEHLVKRAVPPLGAAGDSGGLVHPSQHLQHHWEGLAAQWVGDAVPLPRPPPSGVRGRGSGSPPYRLHPGLPCHGGGGPLRGGVARCPQRGQCGRGWWWWAWCAGIR